jgi:hypothetical protein
MVSDIEQALAVRPMSCYWLARSLRRRKADVLAALIANQSRFEHVGKRRGSLWGLRRVPNGQEPIELFPERQRGIKSLTMRELAQRWRIRQEDALAFLTYWEAQGVTECVAGLWRLTEWGDQVYGQALRNCEREDVLGAAA